MMRLPGPPLHPASLTMASLGNVIFLTFLADPWMIGLSIVLVLGIHAVLRGHSLVAMIMAVLGALATGLGLGITHGLFPGPGAHPYLAWAYALRPLAMVLWSMVLACADRMDWAMSLHRFWGLPLAWSQGTIAALRQVPLMRHEAGLVRRWHRLNGSRGSATLALTVRALRLGAQASLALGARTICIGGQKERTWLRPLTWTWRDTILMAAGLAGLVLPLLCGAFLNGGVVFWNGRF